MKIFSIFILIACLSQNAVANQQQKEKYRISKRQAPRYCIMSNNFYGTCFGLSYCPEIIEIYKTQPSQVARNYILAAQHSCGTRSINRDPLVCCSRPSTKVADQQITISSTATSIIENHDMSCRGPDTRDGICVIIEQCPVLVNELIVKSDNETFVNYLRASNRICGSLGSAVCCPSSAGTNASLKPTHIANTNSVPRQLPTVEEGCGYTTNSFKKIVGGTVSKIGAWPWAVLVGYDDDLSTSPFKCGGTLITARHVVTAAHCIRNDLSFVRLGEHDLTIDTETKHEDIPVVRRESHPDYNPKNGRNDIAILYLKRNVGFTDLISPICLPFSSSLRSKSYMNYTPFVVGWGKTMEGGTSASVLQELQIPIYNNKVCRDSYKQEGRLKSEDQFDEGILCAGVLTGGKDTCQGDSGGPLMIPEPYGTNVRYYLIGVVSYGIGCARPNVPGAYTSIQYFIDWIIKNVADTR